MEIKKMFDWKSTPFFVKVGIVTGAALVLFLAGRELGRFIYHIVH